MYKVSSYNITTKNSNNDLLIMNMRTQKHLKVSSGLSDEVTNLLESSEFELNEDKYKPLIESGFIIPSNFDEARWVELKHNKVVYGTETLSVTILPTNDCNFRCVYCYQDPKPKYMTLEVEKKISRFFERNVPHSRLVRVSWFGGEPLLNREQTCRIAADIDKICKKNRVPLVGMINTNGYNLDLETFKKLISCRVLSYEICLDGPKEIHNKSRPHAIDSDSYSKILENLITIKNNVKSPTWKITIRCNVTVKMNGYFESYIKTLSDHFSNDKRFHIYFQGVRNWGGDRIDQESIVGSEDDIYKKWYDEASKANLTSAESFSLEPFSGYCDANRSNGHMITYDGKLHKCAIAMYDEKYSHVDNIGYINEYGQAIMDEFKLADWTVRQTAIPDKCKECKMFPLCVGGSCFYQLNIRGELSCNNMQEVAKAKLRSMDYKKMLITIGGNSQ